MVQLALKEEITALILIVRRLISLEGGDGSDPKVVVARKSGSPPSPADAGPNPEASESNQGDDPDR